MGGIADDVDDLVIKALSHHERKNILRIVASYPDGVNYTGILGESGLSTGKLNYHLGELAGFLERGEGRLYRLTQPGKKAVAVLGFIHQDVDPGILELADTRRARRLRTIRKNMDHGFYFLGIAMITMTGVFGNLAWVEDDPVLNIFTGLFSVLVAFIMYMTNRPRLKDPERVPRVIEWFEWRVLGKNQYRRS